MKKSVDNEDSDGLDTSINNLNLEEEGSLGELKTRDVEQQQVKIIVKGDNADDSFSSDQ